MATAMVTVGGTETPGSPPPPPEPRSRAVILAAIGLGTGLALGALFTGTGQPPETTVATVVPEPDSSPTTQIISTTTTDVVEPRLATLVPGILDVLVAAGVDPNGTATVTVWELADRAPSRAPLPWGQLMPDASRTWLAVGTPSRWQSQTTTLWVGNAAYMEPIPTRLAGQPVWHNRFPGRLAWIDVTDGELAVMTADFAPGTTTTPVSRFPVSEGTSLLAWSDAGLLMWGDDGLELREISGDVVTTMPVTAVQGVGSNFAAVHDEEGTPLVVPIGMAEALPVRWDADCHRVRWSGNGLAAVAWCGHGSNQRVEYWGDPVLHDEPLFSTSDDEFVDIGFTSTGLPYFVSIDPIRPASTILFYHPADDSTHELAYPGRIAWLTTLQS